MKNSIKQIRIGLFSILLLMFSGYVIVEYVDYIKIRTLLFGILFILITILALILLKNQKCSISKIMILDLFNVVIFIGLIAIFGKSLSEINKMQNAFHGNNEFLSSYSKSIGSKGYEDFESAVEDAIEYREESSGQKEVEEIYRIQETGKAFVYLKEAEDIAEIEFFLQDDLYYRSGSKVLIYADKSGDTAYTTEETIKKDIANTMWRGVGNKEAQGPAWGVSCDEQIYMLTINGKKIKDVIEIEEKEGKKYYFWIIDDVEEIMTIDDVGRIKIENGNTGKT